MGKERKPSWEAHKFRAHLGRVGLLSNQLRSPQNLKVGGESWNFSSVGGYLPGMHKALGPTSSVRGTWGMEQEKTQTQLQMKGSQI